jgi:hypothetical protein
MEPAGENEPCHDKTYSKEVNRTRKNAIRKFAGSYECLKPFNNQATRSCVEATDHHEQLTYRHSMEQTVFHGSFAFASIL